MPARPDRALKSKESSGSSPVADKKLIEDVTDFRQNHVTSASPATGLRYQIETAFSDPTADDTKWSARKTPIFLILVCGGFWFAIGALLIYLF